MACRIFLISPASCSGRRAELLFRDRAAFDLAVRVRGRSGAPLGEVFEFLSGLYFRGKLAYARRFARPPQGLPGVFVITSGEGLRSPEEPVRVTRLRRFGRVDIDAANPSYRRPTTRDARRIQRAGGSDLEVVLLGSIATGKYVDVLGEVFGEKLLFPSDFVGRGDMSRGGLLLRRAREGRELSYASVGGAIRHGPRPPKLPPLRRPLRPTGGVAETSP